MWSKTRGGSIDTVPDECQEYPEEVDQETMYVRTSVPKAAKVRTSVECGCQL